MDRGTPGRILVAIGRALRAVPRSLAAVWRSLSIGARRRLALALAAAVAALLFFAVLVPNLPCSLPGGDYCAPDDDAQELVPADALLYVHANLDEDEEDYERAVEAAERIPVVSGQLIDRLVAQLPQPVAGRLDFDEDVRPWFDGEVVLALLPRPGGRPERVVLIEVGDSDEAQAFADQVTVGVPRTEDVEGVEVEIGAGGTAVAQTAGFLVLGSRPGVSEVIATATGADRSEALADDADAADVRDELPEHRFADVYLSADGIEELIVDARGTLTSLTPLLAPGASRGAAAALTGTDDGGLEVAVRSLLDPEQANARPGFFAAFPSFEPKLPERLPEDSLAYLGIGAPRTAVTALLQQAADEAPGIAASFRDLVDNLSEDVDIRRDLLDSLGGEAAFALQPRGTDAGPSLPFLEFVATGVDDEAARSALAGLQRPLIESVDPAVSGAAPVFDELEIEGEQARSLQLSPTVEFTYAVFDDLAVIATDPEGIGQLARDEGGLDEAGLYERATEDFADDDVSMLGFFDLGELVDTAERLGLAEDPLYATFAGEFRRLDALGFAVTSGEELLSADARLLLSEDDRDGGQADPAPGGSD